MKRNIVSVFLTLATTLGFAQDAVPAPFETKPNFSSIEKATDQKSFTYLRMGVSDNQLPSKDMHTQVIPGFGLGHRIAWGAFALDLSASYNRRQIMVEDVKEWTYSYTLPKANYLYYITPAKDSSLYAGAGLAWGGMKTKGEEEFHGLIPNAAIGYEMNRNATWKSFVQLDISQPVAAKWSYSRADHPKAFAELALGAGF